MMERVTSRKLAEYLLNIGAVKFNVQEPFIWASGTASPIYCDNRLINSDPFVRTEVVKCLTDKICAKFPEVQVIAGVATGGIAIGVLIADRMGLPFIYVRGEPKKYGLKKQIEGYCTASQKVILFEDHISTGGSSLKAVKALKAADLDLICLLSIMTYNFSAANLLFFNEQLHHESICNLEVVLEVAAEKNILSQQEVDEILRFRASPAVWVTRQ